MSQRENTRDTEEAPECPTCGRTDFKSKLGMQQHHAKVHGEKITVETVICDYCGADIERHPRMNEKGDQNFCDLDCFGKWASENRSGKNHPQYKGVKSEVECAYCGELFIKKDSKIERSERDYCSPECWNNHRSEVIVGENHPNYNQVEVDCAWCGETLLRSRLRVEGTEAQFCDVSCMGEWESENYRGENNPAFGLDYPEGEDNPEYNRIDVNCAWCGKELKRIPSRVKASINQFCNTECQARWYSKHQQGENHHQYQGGQANYGIGWTPRKRRKVRERDGYRCQDCGLTSEEHLDDFGAKLHVHHIIKAREFADDERAHRMENLITLCNRCHMKWEQIPGLRPDTGG